ncbi:hypothetical protein BC629DRAFT_1438438 [Irpex lacteus]|nr:hypothetical protein BC629DRAFT_1438438 [Irpex lacteus]
MDSAAEVSLRDFVQDLFQMGIQDRDAHGRLPANYFLSFLVEREHYFVQVQDIYQDFIARFSGSEGLDVDEVISRFREMWLALDSWLAKNWELESVQMGASSSSAEMSPYLKGPTSETIEDNFEASALDIQTLRSHICTLQRAFYRTDTNLYGVENKLDEHITEQKSEEKLWRREIKTVIKDLHSQQTRTQLLEDTVSGIQQTQDLLRSQIFLQGAVHSELFSERRSPFVSTMPPSIRCTTPHSSPLYGAAKVYDADYKRSNVASSEALSTPSNPTALPLWRANADSDIDASHEDENSCETESTCVCQGYGIGQRQIAVDNLWLSSSQSEMNRVGESLVEPISENCTRIANMGFIPSKPMKSTENSQVCISYRRKNNSIQKGVTMTEYCPSEFVAEGDRYINPETLISDTSSVDETEKCDDYMHGGGGEREFQVPRMLSQETLIPVIQKDEETEHLETAKVGEPAKMQSGFREARSPVIDDWLLGELEGFQVMLSTMQESIKGLNQQLDALSEAQEVRDSGGVYNISLLREFLVWCARVLAICILVYLGRVLLAIAMLI